MRGKGSRLVSLPGGRQDQESDEKEESGESEGRDLQITERLVGVGNREPVEGAAGSRCRGLTGRGLVDGAVRDQHVVDRDARPDDRQRQEVPRRPVVTMPREDQQQDRQRIHADPLVPAELARQEVRDQRKEEAAAGRDRRDDERGPQLVAPEPAADPVERYAYAEERQQRQKQEEADDHLAGDPEPGEDVDRVADPGREHAQRHRAAGYPEPRRSLRWSGRGGGTGQTRPT